MAEPSSHFIKPTTSILYYLLGNLKTKWYVIGKELGVSRSTLDAIKRDHKLCYRRMIEMFHELDGNCTWSDVVTALKNIHEKDLAEKVEHYTDELQRIEMSLPSDICKRLVPMRQYSYENWCLDIPSCELGKAEICSDMSLATCLMQSGAATKWYQIGIFMNVPKWYLDTIEEDYQDITEKVRKMVIWLGKSRCKWQTLVKALSDLELSDAARLVENLAKRNGYTEMVLKFNHREFKRQDFNSREYQLSIDKLHEVMNIPKNKGLFSELHKYNRHDKDELHAIVNNIQTIEEKWHEHSEEIEEEVKELAEELDMVKMVTASLKKQKNPLQQGKELLQNRLSHLEKAIRDLECSNEADDPLLVKLQEQKREVEFEIRELDKQLDVNDQEKEKMEAASYIVCENMRRCQDYYEKCINTLVESQDYAKSKYRRLKTDRNYRFIKDDGTVVALTAVGLVGGALSGAAIGLAGGPIGVVVGGTVGGLAGAMEGYTVGTAVQAVYRWLNPRQQAEINYAYLRTFENLEKLISTNANRVQDTQTRLNDIKRILDSASTN